MLIGDEDDYDEADDNQNEKNLLMQEREANPFAVVSRMDSGTGMGADMSE